MIIVMREDLQPSSEEVGQLVRFIDQYPGIKTEVRRIQGATRALTEVYLIGNTAPIPSEPFEQLGGVERVIRIRERYRTIGRHEGGVEALGFDYRGLHFTQESFHLFPGPCAVDSVQNLEATFRALKDLGIRTTRAGVYKPRTSPYDFQGRGKECLPSLFELAGKYGIQIIAIEVTRERHVDEIREALHITGAPTGVMLQIGTRNAQNFELLKFVGQQSEFPVLYKRGMGITLEESLNACEYLAASGNQRIVFGLRGMKSNLGDPHRNFVDFAHVPTLKKLTRMPIRIDPSHAVGRKNRMADGLLDIEHATAQGVIAGANMVLVDVHPNPKEALCDGPQALLLNELEEFAEDVDVARTAYLKRLELRRARQLRAKAG